jgi:hypothetical protein
MTDDNNTASDAIQIDEDILTYTVSDEAIESAAGMMADTATRFLDPPVCFVPTFTSACF